MDTGENYGICTRCLTPLHQVEGLDSEAALRGEYEYVPILRLVCPVWLQEASDELMRIIVANDPQFQSLLDLVEQGVDPDELPGYSRHENEDRLRRLLDFLDDEPEEQ